MIARKQKTAVTVISKIAERCKTSDACLVVIYGDELGRKYTLAQGQLTIGRSAQCDIQIDQEAISRQHAKVVAGFGETMISDLGSTNGTYVNDAPVQEQALRDGDKVKIGNTIFKFLSGGNIERDYHEEIYRMTIVDGLTGAFNKRSFLEHCEREAARALRHARPLSLCMIDIDHFKAINDQYGHLTGDHVLKELARRIIGRTRKEEIFARYGGEEFVVLLPEADHESAITLAEQLRVLIEREDFLFDGDQIHVTISVGVTTIDPAGVAADAKPEIDAFIKAADENLYRAKRSGRNRVVG
jgi:diguanylate cyclase (GGDEF)-like protein